MTPQKTKSRYRPAQKIVNWGCSFDSLTELKYAVSILDEYDFMRARISIYYHPGTLQPTEYIRECHRRYTPDFLVRHRQSGAAWLVEVKPRAFANDPQLLLRKKVAENYIRWKNYDWKFKVVFNDEIILSVEQCEEFEHCRKLKSLAACKVWYQEYLRRYDRSVTGLFSGLPPNANIQYIMFGHQAALRNK